MSNNQINATVGLDTRDLRLGVSSALDDLTRLGGGLGSLARQLQRQQQALTLTTDEILEHRIATTNMSEAQRDALRNAHLWNRTLAHTQAAEQAAAQAEAKRKQAIDSIINGLNREVNALGRTNTELQLNELRSLGATRAQIQQARAAQNLIAAHERLNRVSGSNGATLGSVGATLAMVGGASGLIQTLDGWTALQNRLKLVHETSQDVATAQAGIVKIAKETGSNLGSVATVYQRFAQNQRELGLTISDSIALTDTVSKTISLSGVSAASSEAALQQFGQALASGVLRGEEFNSVMEQAPALAQTLAKGLNVNIGQLRAMANDGKLTTDVVIGALQRMRESVNADFAKTTTTISGAFEILKTNFTEFVGKTDESTGAANRISKAIIWAAENINLLAGGLTALIAIKMGAWAVMSAASLAQTVAAMIALRSAAGTAAVANGANAVAIARTGTAAQIAAVQVSGLSGAVSVLGLAARSTTTSMTLLAGRLLPFTVAAAPFAAAAAAVTAGLTAIFSAIDVARGKSGDNWISNLANGAADMLGLIDGKTESIGTKLYDWLNPVKGVNSELEKQKALVNEIEAKIGYQSVAGKMDAAGGIAQFQAENSNLEDLKKSLGDTVVKYREQINELGKSKEELVLLRLETEKQVILKKQQAAYENQFKNSKDKERLVAESMAKFVKELDKDFQTAQSAIKDFTQKTAEAKAAEEAKTAAVKQATEQQERQNRVNQTLKDMQIELDKVGKSAKEIKLMDLKNAGATQAQLDKAKSLLDLQELREKQFESVGKSIDTSAKSFQAAADTQKSYIETQAEILRQQAEAYNKQRELERQANLADHNSKQGGLSNEQWREYSLKKYGHEFYNLLDEFQKVSQFNKVKSLDDMVQAAVEAAGQNQSASGTNAASSQTIENQNIFSNAVNNFQAAVMNFSDVLAKSNNQVMQKVELDLTLPDGRALTSVLFAEPEFVKKLREASTNSMYSEINKQAMAVS